VENAKTLASSLVDLGYAIVSGGTDTHLMLVDLRPKNLTGKAAEKTLGEAGITVNKNTVPDDPQSPFVTSGIRLGTPALTTRGMGPEEMVRVAQLIDESLTHPDEKTLARVRGEVGSLTAAFPLYQPVKTAGGVRRSA
jgi:glycine hydroxymethyltransferase